MDLLDLRDFSADNELALIITSSERAGQLVELSYIGAFSSANGELLPI
jgi:hypothetical protein